MKSRVKIYSTQVLTLLLLGLTQVAYAYQFTNDDWSPNYALPGAVSSSSNSPIFDILKTSEGYYITGSFSSIDGVAANSVAFWDGTNWNALGEGLLNNDGTIGEGLQLVKDGESIYVVGQFTKAGIEEVSNIAVWNETTEIWSGIPGEFNGGINSVLKNGSLVFVGGSFTEISGVPYNRIAVWDGESWSSFNGGVSGPVNVIKRHSGQYYFGGDFSIAGATAVNNMATWTGTNWNSIGGGSNGTIYDMHFIGDSLLVGGVFSTLGGESINNLGIRTDEAWSGFDIEPDNTVFDIDGTHNEIMIAGEFEQIGILSTSGFAVWNGSSWQVPSNTLSIFTSVFAAEKNGDKWVVVGDFNELDGDLINNIIAVNESTFEWEKLSLDSDFNGINGSVYVAKYHEGVLYIGGNFSGIGDQKIKNFAARIDGEWIDYGASPNGTVRDILVTGSQIYIAGSFTNIGGIVVNNVAEYDKNAEQWVTMDDGLNGNVYTLEIEGSNLYAGGTFTQSGGSSRARVARWSGSTWTALGSGITTGSIVHDLEVLNGKLYAGGTFSEAGGVAADNIAAWNGSNWEALGTGTDGPVNALAKTDSSLYVGGDFETSGGKSSGSYISEWILDTEDWQPLEEGLNDEVQALHIEDNVLFAGGFFTTTQSTGLIIGGKKEQLNGITYYNGEKWNPIGSGLSVSTSGSPFVRSLTSDGDELIVAGFFDRAGDKVSNDLASLNLSAKSVSNEEESSEVTKFTLSQNYPNPFNPSTTISFELEEAGLTTLKVFNMLGQEVSSLIDQNLSKGNYSVSFEATNLPSGVYMYQLTSGSVSKTKKMLLLK